MAASNRLTMTALTLLKTSRASSPPLPYSRAKLFDFSKFPLSRHCRSSYSNNTADWLEFREMAEGRIEWERTVDLVKAAGVNPGLVETEDFMKFLVKQGNGLAGRIFSKAGLDNTSILEAIDDFISKKQPKVLLDNAWKLKENMKDDYTPKLYMGKHLNSLLDNAWKLKEDMKDDFLSMEHFILAFYLDRRFGKKLFTNFGVSEKDLRDAIDDVRGSLKRELNEHWGIEKELMNRIRNLKEEIDRVNVEIESADRAATLASLRRQLEEAEKHLADIVSKWTGTHFEDFLKERVFGQNVAVKSVADAIRRSRAGLSDPNRPIASFMFMGPEGVGKKTLVNTLADYLFKTEEPLEDYLYKAVVRIDMNGYIGKNAVSRLVVALGSCRQINYEVVELTEYVRQRPYCMILFEEIEKVHPDVLSVLLEILDNGRIRDGQGRTVCFKNTVIIMTSKIGSHLIPDTLSSNTYDIMKKQVVDLARETFGPQFMNCIDECILFKKLEIRNLAEKMMRELKGLDWDWNWNWNRNIELQYTEEVIDVVGRLVYDPNYEMEDFGGDFLGVLWSVRDLRFPRDEFDDYLDDDCDVFDVVKVDVDSDLGLGRIRCKLLPTHYQIYLGTDETCILNFRESDQWGIEKELMNRITTLKEKIHKSNVEKGAGTLTSFRHELEEAEKHLAEIESKWAGTRLEDALNEAVVGQKEAVTSVADAIRRSRAGLSGTNPGVASFLFIGPQGVGKTELAKALARYLFNSENALVRIDMGRCVVEDSVLLIDGLPYSNRLPELVGRRPYCVILFDEIEKANQDVLKIVLQILENGMITSRFGQTVSFKNTVVIMTSHIDSHGTKDNDILKKQVFDSAPETFGPELMNLIDECIVFNPITAKEIEEIQLSSSSKLKNKTWLLLQRIYWNTLRGSPSVAKLLAIHSRARSLYTLASSPLLGDSRAKLPLVRNVVPFNISTTAVSRHLHSSSACSSCPIIRRNQYSRRIHESDDALEFTLMAWDGIEKAADAARENKLEWVETEHLMKALLDQKDGLARRIFRRAGLDNTSILQATRDFLSKYGKVSGDTSHPIMGRYMSSLLENARKHKNDMKDELVSVEHLILAFYFDRRLGQRLLRNLSEKDLRDAIDAVRGSQKRKLNDQWGMEKELIRSLKEEIDVINVAMEAGTRISLRRQLEDAEKHLAEIESKWTGTHFEDFLKEHVVGQNEAVKSVADAIGRSRAGLSDSNRPIASFMFMGPRSVGKNKLVNNLAHYLFYTENAFVRTFIWRWSGNDYVSGLVGPSPLNICYEKFGPLTEIVRRMPYCVIHFECIQSAHQDALDILSQILENGRITDYQGRTVSFNNTVIIMTYDIGDDILKKQVFDLALEKFGHEFMNHIDECIVFNPRKVVAEAQMSRLKERLKQRNVELHYTAEVIDMLARNSWSSYANEKIERFMEHSIARRNFKKDKVFVLNVELNPDLDFDDSFGKPTRKRTHFLFYVGARGYLTIGTDGKWVGMRRV